MSVTSPRSNRVTENEHSRLVYKHASRQRAMIYGIYYPVWQGVDLAVTGKKKSAHPPYLRPVEQAQICGTGAECDRAQCSVSSKVNQSHYAWTTRP